MDRVRGPCQCSGLHTGIFNTSKMPRWFSVFSLHSDLLRMVQEAQVLEDVWGLLVDARKAYPRVFATGLKSRRLQTVFGNPMVGGPYRSIPGATFSSSLCLCVSALSQHQYCTMSHGSQHRVIPKDLPKDLRQIIIKAEWAVGIRMKAVRMKTEAWAKQKAHTAELAGPMSTLLSYAKCVSDCLCTA